MVLSRYIKYNDQCLSQFANDDIPHFVHTQAQGDKDITALEKLIKMDLYDPEAHKLTLRSEDILSLCPERRALIIEGGQGDSIGLAGTGWFEVNAEVASENQSFVTYGHKKGVKILVSQDIIVSLDS